MTVTIEKPQIYCFADEAGNFDFRPPTASRNASRFFVLTTVTMNSCAVGDALLELRRSLAIQGRHDPSHFHAAEDSQGVRDAVFDVLARHDFRVDATVFEKCKAYPSVKDNERYFYRLAWYLHFKYAAPLIGGVFRRPILVVAASVSTKGRQSEFHAAVRSVADQVYPGPIETAMWPSASDPCLWVADYCTWAIQRKWERGDERSYRLVKDRIRSEFDVWRRGTALY